ncbi:hypothetical protein Ga0123461_1828 [Mariprofundus aestuarium]|uniref:Uncharacterized protein n=1 Tax=Mariprofundus aestuarium TaxID=1921086 RepID=A0A2K8L325_MARES|nr:hypothetical protein [Mariprofundus aestuarium]ATX80241.1 hypothetical protein Ga0123461_1828 [Mariprofundus aestuarium]
MTDSRALATSSEGWVIEIMDAYQDAKAAIPFAEAAGKTMSEADLFHMAPLVCVKFRNLLGSEESLTNARNAAIGSYIANQEAGNRNLNDPIMAFSFCYILAHYGLGLLDDEKCQEILMFIEDNLAKIKMAIAA